MTQYRCYQRSFQVIHKSRSLLQVLSVLAKSKELLELLRKVDVAYGGHIYGRPHQRNNLLLDLAPTIQEQLQVMRDLFIFWTEILIFLWFVFFLLEVHFFPLFLRRMKIQILLIRMYLVNEILHEWH